MKSNIVCDNCMNNDFYYDSKNDEYSCYACGEILTDESKVFALKAGGTAPYSPKGKINGDTKTCSSENSGNSDNFSGMFGPLIFISSFPIFVVSGIFWLLSMFDILSETWGGYTLLIAIGLLLGGLALSAIEDAMPKQSDLSSKEKAKKGELISFRCKYCGESFRVEDRSHVIFCPNKSCGERLHLIGSKEFEITDNYISDDGKHKYQVSFYKDNSLYESFNMEAKTGKEVKSILDEVRKSYTMNPSLVTGNDALAKIAQYLVNGYTFHLTREYVRWNGNIISYCYEEEWKEFVRDKRATGKF